jgi:hypothetical protein
MGRDTVPKIKEPVNPFYVLLVIVGVVFVITSCGYGLMAWRAMRPEVSRAATDHREGETAGVAGREGHPLMRFLDRHGVEVLSGELIVLGAATFGAMWLDGLRTRRAAASQTQDDERPNVAGSNGMIG